MARGAVSIRGIDAGAEQTSEVTDLPTDIERGIALMLQVHGETGHV